MSLPGRRRRDSSASSSSRSSSADIVLRCPHAVCTCAYGTVDELEEHYAGAHLLYTPIRCHHCEERLPAARSLAAHCKAEHDERPFMGTMTLEPDKERRLRRELALAAGRAEVPASSRRRRSPNKDGAGPSGRPPSAPDATRSVTLSDSGRSPPTSGVKPGGITVDGLRALKRKAESMRAAAASQQK